MDIVRGEAIFALRLGLDVMAVRVDRQSVEAFVEVGAAAREHHVVAARRVVEDVDQRALARRCRPHEMPCRGIQAVQRARAPGVHVLLVVVEVEAVEVDALPAIDLLDAQDLAAAELDGLARAGLEPMREQELARGCMIPPDRRSAPFPLRGASALGGPAALIATSGGEWTCVAPSRTWFAAYSCNARRTSATRSVAAPRSTVLSMSSSCCWFSFNTITFCSIGRAPLGLEFDWQRPHGANAG